MRSCFVFFLLISFSFFSCVDDFDNEPTNPITNNSDGGDPPGDDGTDTGTDGVTADAVIAGVFGERLDLNDLFNYENQVIPNYINNDNQRGNEVTDIGATLGRVLFYDTQLSSTNSISCASCHSQDRAFGDSEVQSQGANGMTGRHSMRLINARFSDELRFFWDERAQNLEDQTTQPIEDHIEMGFSGQNGDPSIGDLTTRLGNIDYYQVLFNEAFGSPVVNENRMQNALAQFIRSIQSFDSKYDQGRITTNNRQADFPNFTDQENQGKRLFLQRADCATCHEGDEFSIDPDSRNNGVIGTIGSNLVTLNVTKSPTLRDMFDSNGTLNGPLMHDGSLTTMEDVIDHYDDIDFNQNVNPQLDPRLRGGGNGNNGGNGQNLNLTQNEKDAIVAFLRTLSGNDVYTNPKWSTPFSNN